MSKTYRELTGKEKRQIKKLVVSKRANYDKEYGCSAMRIAEQSITGRKRQRNEAVRSPASTVARFLLRHETALNTALMIAGMRHRSSGRANGRKHCGKQSTNRHRLRTNKKQHNDI